MLSYEIIAVVESDIAAEFESYMRETHIGDVIATGCFSKASFFRTGDKYLIRYEADSHEMIHQYLSTKAADLRSDFLERFPHGVELTRETWELLAEYDCPTQR